MIVGLTHSESGEPIQRLAVGTKVAIGLPPDSTHNYPRKLDRFVFLKKSIGKDRLWEIDEKLMNHYGESRMIDIILLDDDIENVFRTQYAWWGKTQCKCWGNGKEARRRTERAPDGNGEEWPGDYVYTDGAKKGQGIEPCGRTCPDLIAGRCKPSGDLTFMLADFPQLGNVCRLHTGSYASVGHIYSGLEQIQVFTGGRLAGLKGQLIVRPELTSRRCTQPKPECPKESHKHSITIYALSFEIVRQKNEDIQHLLGGMTEYARVFEQTRKLLGGKRIQVVEDEQDIAPELTDEFYPEKEPEDPPNLVRVTGAPMLSPPAETPAKDSTEKLEHQKDVDEVWEKSTAKTKSTPEQKSDAAAEPKGRTLEFRGVASPIISNTKGEKVRKMKWSKNQFVVFKVNDTEIRCKDEDLFAKIAALQGKEVEATCEDRDVEGKLIRELRSIGEVVQATTAPLFR